MKVNKLVLGLLAAVIIGVAGYFFGGASLMKGRIILSPSVTLPTISLRPIVKVAAKERGRMGSTNYNEQIISFTVETNTVTKLEKAIVDLKLSENWASPSTTTAYLKQNGVTVATGEVDFGGVTTTKTGKITFTPNNNYGDIVIKPGTDTFKIEMDTASAITDDSSATEQLTVIVAPYFVGVSVPYSISTISSY